MRNDTSGLSGFPFILHLNGLVICSAPFDISTAGHWLGPVIFLLVMLPLLRLHDKRPLLAYGLSVVSIVLLMYWFEVSWFKSGALSEELITWK